MLVIRTKVKNKIEKGNGKYRCVLFLDRVAKETFTEMVTIEDLKERWTLPLWVCGI